MRRVGEEYRKKGHTLDPHESYADVRLGGNAQGGRP
jgi:hypothetical protein